MNGAEFPLPLGDGRQSLPEGGLLPGLEQLAQGLKFA